MSCCSENVSKGTLINMRLIRDETEDLSYPIKQCPLCRAQGVTAFGNVDFAEATLKMYNGFKEMPEYVREKQEKAKKDGKTRE